MAEPLRASNVPEVEHYVLGPLIGRGSMGAVYEAVGPEGTVALKILHAEVTEHEMAITRFEREVALAKRIDHPAVPKIFDAGPLPDGRLFLAMERLYGESLEDWWDTPGRPIATALELLLEALGPVAAAHRLGIVHRDLKPENVFVLAEPDARGRIRLLDFGIARHVDDDAKAKTATGVAVGTPVYMSPEQATKPRLASLPTDVWSFGVMLYEALTGELPFDGDTPHAVIIAVATEAHVPLLERAPDVHPELAALVERCLQKNPNARPADAAALESALAALLEREDVRATLTGFAATPPFQLRGSRPVEATADDSDVSAIPLVATSASGTRRIAASRSRAIWVWSLAAMGLLALGGWAWSQAETAAPPATAAPSASTVGPNEEEDPTPSEPPAPTREDESELGPEPEVSLGDDEVLPEPEPEPTRVARVARPVAPAPSEPIEAPPTGDAPQVDDALEPEVEEPSTVAVGPAPVAPSMAAAPTAEPAATTPATEPASPATSPAASPQPTTRTVRRVVRRAAPAPQRPGFVTF
ncbi:MAG: serine/threonine protein kinase [Sandaracinus sp.]|nr:serine/threonine protein kinase [Sandaracinus sp.]MCB9622950.1 serine/threonine protein kinase [Sandaracinus sp.]